MTVLGRLEGCGCCEGVRPLTPASVENAPGRPALAYRVGTHGTFKHTMMAALSTRPALAKLTTRQDGDHSIALLDAWATVLDVLTFYQERVANEGYLRTAAERLSVLELARSIGYELGPGVAAGTHLAFELETAPGAPERVAIAAGTRVQSVPGPGETPQTFETVEDLEARGEWNAIRPRPARLRTPAFGDTDAYLQGVGLNLEPGDGLLFVGADRRDDVQSEAWDFRVITSVDPDAEAGHTVVTWEEELGWEDPPYRWEATQAQVHVLRRRAGIFGHNAPDWRSVPEGVRQQLGPTPAPTPNDGRWPGPRWAVASPDVVAGTGVDLDSVYKGILPDSWAVLAAPDSVELYRVTSVTQTARADFTLTGKVSRLTLHGEPIGQRFGQRVRETAVFAESEPLDLALTPITDDVTGDQVELDRTVDGLVEGKVVIVAGLDVDTDEPAAEAAVLSGTEPEDAVTKLLLGRSLERSYRRDTVVIRANVARATHGETKEEVLGSGDAARPFQAFALRNVPLTHVSAATPSGVASTLEVRIDDVLWDQVRSLFGTAPSDRVYVTRIDDDGKVAVRFGDGERGARLPTGAENVRARYRVGSGLPGMVEAGQLSLLMTRPLGVKGVTNPAPATGAADPETLDEARTNAPRTVRTFDRVVSLRDFEDFARSFAGIGKAGAVWLWDGENRVVHITVGAADGGPVEQTSDLYRNLEEAIRDSGDYRRRFLLQSYQALPFRVGARILVDPRHLTEGVLGAVQGALRDAFSFERRAFAQPVASSDVMAVIQGVEGVVAVDLEALHRTSHAPSLADRLPARSARLQPDGAHPAELLILDPDPGAVHLTEMPA